MTLFVSPLKLGKRGSAVPAARKQAQRWLVQQAVATLAETCCQCRIKPSQNLPQPIADPRSETATEVNENFLNATLREQHPVPVHPLLHCRVPMPWFYKNTPRKEYPRLTKPAAQSNFTDVSHRTSLCTYPAERPSHETASTRAVPAGPTKRPSAPPLC